jgi:hypothetical protein
MRKGDNVRLRADLTDRARHGQRPTTEEEVEAWYASDDSKGMDCAGETKLPPQVAYHLIVPGREYLVKRARCRPRLGYYDVPGMALLLCPVTDVEFYVHRDNVTVV